MRRKGLDSPMGGTAACRRAPPRLQPAPRYNVKPWLGHVGLISRSSQAHPLLLFTAV